MSSRISESTVLRLSLYLRMLRKLTANGVELVSSSQLAERAGATSAQVRKDLSLFGSFGKRGRGYDVETLRRAIEDILGLSRVWRVGVVGVGKIGAALLGYQDMVRRGFEVVAAFDVEPSKIGREIFGLQVSPLADLDRVVRERQVEIAIIATPPDAATEVAAKLSEAGVDAILNFAPTGLPEVEGVPVRTVDVVLALEGLSYLVTSGERNGAD